MSDFDFIHPGDLSTRTGGYRYARQLLAALARRDVTARVHRLADSFPFPDATDLAQAGALLAGMAASRVVVVDGLAFGVMAPMLATHAKRLKLVALVHHPLALETGLDEVTVKRLALSERAALASARAVVVTSPATALALGDYGVEAARLTVVLPGTQQPLRLARRPSSDGPLRLLCVASLTPRKGHLELIDALGALTRRRPDADWHLRCIGSPDRDRAYAARVRERVVQLGLGDRVTLAGELDEVQVDLAYQQADLFVLASHHEGYGMVLAEAVSHGLPVVSTTAGAIPETVPAGAAVLVKPGDVAGLAEVLEQVISQAPLRAALAAAARDAAGRLPDWEEAARGFESVLRSLDPAPRSAGLAR